MPAGEVFGRMAGNFTDALDQKQAAAVCSGTQLKTHHVLPPGILQDGIHFHLGNFHFREAAVPHIELNHSACLQILYPQLGKPLSQQRIICQHRPYLVHRMLVMAFKHSGCSLRGRLQSSDQLKFLPVVDVWLNCNGYPVYWQMGRGRIHY
ncbi:hypothetical protein D3C75_1003040 [compost metagenome]